MKKTIAEHWQITHKIFAGPKFFQQLAEKFRGIFWVFDPETDKMIYVSSGYKEILGRRWKNINEWQEAIHPDDRNEVKQLAPFKRWTDAYDETYRVQRPDGTIRWIRERTFPIQDETGALYRIVGIADDITDFKNIEEASRESEGRFCQIAENINEVLWMESLENEQLLYVSPVYEKIWGRTCQSLYDNPGSFMQTILPEDRPHFSRYLSQQRQGNFYEIEYRITRPDGTVRWIRNRSFPIRNANGKLYRTAGMAEDITERKHTEITLRKNEDRYRALYEDNRDMYFTITEDGTILSVNDFGAGQLGYTAGELVGQSVLSIFYEEDKDKVQKQLFACLQSPRKRHTWELRKVRKDGSMLWVREHAHVIKDDNNKTGILVVCRDITHQKETEIALRESEERFRIIFANTSIGMALIKTDDNFLQVNPALCLMVGYSEDELMGTSLKNITQPEDIDAYTALLKRLLSGELNSQQVEQRYIHKDGETVRALLNLSIVYNAEGRPLYLVAQISLNTKRASLNYLS